ncbi:MAG: hypothetical protein M0026_03820 [Nocardiopsaceae bacterium]|nr:hypothetical protein [Nocardiopsaceae bacterium]
MFHQTVRVLRQSWARGLLSVLLVTAVLVGSICHAESGSAQVSPDRAASLATESAKHAESGPAEAHEHAEASHCEDSEVPGTDNRTGATKLLALGATLIPAPWSGPPRSGGTSRLFRQPALFRSGARLLLSLCIIRV